MTTSSPKTPDPDELCGVCSYKREEHGDKNHEFNSAGVLIPKKTGEPPRQQPPKERGANTTPDATTAAMMRLITRLTVNNTLNGEDLMYIFSGRDANS